MNTFLICSYPRSRSLWFSHFLSSHPGIFCAHDASEHAASAQEYWANLDSMAHYAVGSADTAAILVLPALLASRPMTKIVWVERPLAEVAESMKRAGMSFTQAGAEFLRFHKERHKDLIDLEVTFSDLNYLSVIMEIWDFLFPDLPFDTGTWSRLAKKKIAYTAEDYRRLQPSTDKFLQFLTAEEVIVKC